MGRLLAACAFVWVLSGCNGTSGANGDDPFGSADGDDSTTSPVAVSYTHLTLPTIYSV